MFGALAAPLISGAASSLLGGIGKKKAKTEQVPTMSPEQQKAISSLFGAVTPQIGETFNRSGTGLTESPLFAQLQQAMQPALGGFDPTRTTQSFQQNVADPAMRNFTEQMLPAIQERFGAAGGGQSSALNQSLAREAGNVQTGLSGQLAEMLRLGEQTGVQNQLSGAQQGLGIAGSLGGEKRADIESLLKALGLGLGKDTFALQRTPGQESPLAPMAGALGKSAGEGLSAAIPSLVGKLFGG